MSSNIDIRDPLRQHASNMASYKAASWKIGELHDKVLNSSYGVIKFGLTYEIVRR
jgi:hypothetical protein